MTRHSPAQAPLHPWEFPSAPWECLHANYAGTFLGHMFSSHGRFPKWLEVVKVSSATSGTTIEKLCSIFATHGIPRILDTDNIPQFVSSEFQAFMKNNGITHIYSAPYHPATNGLAEQSIQTFKEHMKCLPVGSVKNTFQFLLIVFTNAIC